MSDYSVTLPVPDYIYDRARQIAQGTAQSIEAVLVQQLKDAFTEPLPALPPDEQSELEALAHHALRGEVWDRAVAYYRQAGAKAATRWALREAAAAFEQALVALQQFPDSRAMREQAIDLRIDLSRALWPLGNHAQRFEYLYQAEILAEGIDDKQRLGRLFPDMIQHFRVMGDDDRLIEYSERAHTLARAIGDFRLQVSTHLALGRAYYDMCDYHRAIEFLGKIVASLAGGRSHERFSGASALSRVWLAMSLVEQGKFAEGIAHAEEAVRIAAAVENPFSLTQAYFGVGGLYVTKGELQQAIRALEHSLELCQIRDLPLLFPMIASQLGYAYALTGRVAEALTLMEQGMEQGMKQLPSLSSSSRPRWVAYLSEAYLLAGRVEDAMQVAGRALSLSREHKGRGHQAYALRLLGEIAAQRQPPEVEQAEAYYRQALALASELDMRPLQAHCHLGLGTLYAKTGRPEPARAEISAAIEMYHTMDMTFWLPQAEAALTQANDGKVAWGK
jgi:tetratricopeptide (TPR) repeat protein